jgi:hypothetical protein
LVIIAKLSVERRNNRNAPLKESMGTMVSIAENEAASVFRHLHK